MTRCCPPTRSAADYEIAGSADLPPHLVERAG
jgi:hypothetical protein